MRDASSGREVEVGRGPSRTSGLALASLGLGLAGLFIAPLIASTVAIVLGHFARRDVKRDPTLAGAGYALVGIVLGWIGVAIGVVFVILLFAVLSGAE